VNIFRLFIEILFPKFCCGCGWIGSFLCDRCYGKLQFYTSPIKIDSNLRYLDLLQAAVHYHSPAVELIKTMKYQGVKDIGVACAQIIQLNLTLPKVDVIVAVPLHRQRRKDRGFNQAEVIALKLSELIHRPYLNLLLRITNTPPQASLKNKKERLVNLSNCFVINQQIKNNCESVLLVDDVTTTGTTLNECAKVLKQCGIKKVYGLTFAHG